MSLFILSYDDWKTNGRKASDSAQTPSPLIDLIRDTLVGDF